VDQDHGERIALSVVALFVPDVERLRALLWFALGLGVLNNASRSAGGGGCCWVLLLWSSSSFFDRVQVAVKREIGAQLLNHQLEAACKRTIFVELSAVDPSSLDLAHARKG